MKRRVNKKELKNCLSCGRDTTRLDGYCKYCICLGSTTVNEQLDRNILRFGRDPITWWTPLHEDRYDENYMLEDVKK